MQATGAPVFRFTHFQGLADIKNNIKMIGYAIGEEQAAAALIAEMDQDIKAIRASIPTDIEPLRVMSYSLAASEAAQAGRIIVIDNRYFLGVSQYLVKGIKALASGLYDSVSVEH